MMDFFEVNTQKTLLKIVSNVSQNINSEEDFKKILMLLPPVMQFLENWESTEIMDLTIPSIKWICEAPLRFFDGYNTLDKVKPYMEEMSEQVM